MKKLIYLVVITLTVMACNPNKSVVSSEEDVKTATETTEVTTDMLEELNEEESSDSLFVVLKRGACYGACPYYEMTIYTSGYVVLDAKQNVVPEGKNTSYVTAQKLTEIKQAAYDINFFDLKEEYDNKGVTDLPANTITLSVDGKIHTVRNRVGGPDNFKDLVNTIHAVIEGSEWKDFSDEK